MAAAETSEASRAARRFMSIPYRVSGTGKWCQAPIFPARPGYCQYLRKALSIRSRYEEPDRAQAPALLRGRRGGEELHARGRAPAHAAAAPQPAAEGARIAAGHDSLRAPAAGC